MYSEFKNILEIGVYLFGGVPGGDLAQVLLRACREFELEGEPKQAIYALEEVKDGFDLLLNLLHA